LQGARAVCVCRAASGSLHSGRGAVLMRRAGSQAGPLSFGLPTLRLVLLYLAAFGSSCFSGRTSPVTWPFRGMSVPGVPLGTLWMLAAAFRIALRSRPTALHVAARVPLPEATAAFWSRLPAWPFARPVSRLRSWPGPLSGAMGSAAAPTGRVLLPRGCRWRS